MKIHNKVGHRNGLLYWKTCIMFNKNIYEYTCSSWKTTFAHCFTRPNYKNHEASVKQDQFWSMKCSKISKCFDILVWLLVSYFTLASLTSRMLTLCFRLCLLLLQCLVHRCKPGVNAYGFEFNSLKLMHMENKEQK